MPLGMEVSLSPGNLVSDGDHAPLPGPCLLWPNNWMDQDGTWRCQEVGVEVGLGPGHIVLDGDTAPIPPKRGRAAPQFSAHLYCGQTAGCIKMPLGIQVGFSPDHCVRWGPSSLSKKGRSPQFSAHVYYGQRLNGSLCHLVRR